MQRGCEVESQYYQFDGEARHRGGDNYGDDPRRALVQDQWYDWR